MALQILIVEDDLPSLALLSEVFLSMHAQVKAFSESMLAAELIDKQKFDGIFLDLQMPGMDGFELAGRIRKSAANRTTPIIIVTGSQEEQIMKRAFSAGGTFFLAKPIDRAKLVKLFHTTQGAMQENRRRFARAPLHTQVACNAGSRALKGLSVNIGDGGILFDAGYTLVVGVEVDLAFSLPNEKTLIQTHGIVVRVDEKGRAGVRFISLHGEDQDRIRRLVDKEGDRP